MIERETKLRKSRKSMMAMLRFNFNPAPEINSRSKLMLPVLCLKDALAARATSRVNEISLERVIILGKRRLNLDFQTVYLKISITMQRVQARSKLVPSWPYQYKFLKYREFMLGGGGGDKGICPLE